MIDLRKGKKKRYQEEQTGNYRPKEGKEKRQKEEQTGNDRPTERKEEKIARGADRK